MSIREIPAAAITDAVEALCIEANTRLPADVKAALDQLTKAVNALSVLPDRPADEEKPADQGDKENTEDQVDTSAAAMAGSYAFALVAGGIALGGIRKRQRSEKK